MNEKKPEESVLFKLIENKIQLNKFKKYINNENFWRYQSEVFGLNLYLMIFAIMFSVGFETYIFIYMQLMLFLILETAIFYNKIKNDLFYNKIIGKETLKELRLKKIKKEKDLLLFLLNDLSIEEIENNFDYIANYLSDDKEILEIFIKNIELDFNKESIIKSKYIKKIIKIKSECKDIQCFLKNEEQFKKYLSKIEFKKLKYEIISENINEYVEKKNSDYLEEIVTYLDEINLNDKNVYLLKETLKIKNEEVEENILKNINTEMVFQF